ncbi:MAG: AraC family transcriptional regulator [Clostridiales bacterium]|nr:AraC family transcriptional regulator [Clostridiales bacterium]
MRSLWIERMNQVVDYVEAHLTDELDMAEIGRIALCPAGTFLRAFALLSGAPLSEYVRRRRLTNAARDLRNGERVIDVALRYGYDSADAFSAAFRRQHGLSPSRARRGGSLTAYSKLTFQLTVKGAEGMTYRTEFRPSFEVAGIRRTTPTGGGTWALIKESGDFDRLAALGGCDLGLCFGFDQDGNNDYLCGFQCGPAGAPEGLDTFCYPDAKWLVFEARGSIASGALGEAWRRIYGELLPLSGGEVLGLPTIERYIAWDEAADCMAVDICIAVRG